MNDGIRKFGQPRTDEERKQRHKSLYGTDNLPPRGTGLQYSQIVNEAIKKYKEKK